MTSNHHAPYVQGFTHATMVGTVRVRSREGELIVESQSQFGLGSATRPHEVGVASNRRSAMLR